MLASQPGFAAPHTPRPGLQGRRAARVLPSGGAAHSQVLNPRRRGRPAARGAFEPRCQARRL